MATSGWRGGSVGERKRKAGGSGFAGDALDALEDLADLEVQPIGLADGANAGIAVAGSQKSGELSLAVEPLVVHLDDDHFDVMQWGVHQARRAGLTKKDVANTKTAKQFLKLIQ